MHRMLYLRSIYTHRVACDRLVFLKVTVHQVAPAGTKLAHLVLVLPTKPSGKARDNSAIMRQKGCQTSAQNASQPIGRLRRCVWCLHGTE
jgi:hypothetical protein